MRSTTALVGVIVIYALLAQKERFVTVDLELFKLLGAHAAAALVGAQLSPRRWQAPGAERLRLHRTSPSEPYSVASRSHL